MSVAALQVCGSCETQGDVYVCGAGGGEMMGGGGGC